MLINQAFHHEILLLQKFNDIGGKVLKPKIISLQPQKKIVANFWLRYISNPRTKHAGLDFKYLVNMTGYYQGADLFLLVPYIISFQWGVP